MPKILNEGLLFCRTDLQSESTAMTYSYNLVNVCHIMNLYMINNYS